MVRRARDDGRPHRQQSPERKHPQFRLLQQERSLAAGHRRARVCEFEVLISLPLPVLYGRGSGGGATSTNAEKDEGAERPPSPGCKRTMLGSADATAPLPAPGARGR